MGKAWFGLILMAAVTSLPELFTGISSILIVDTPDIAVGDILGSCAFNLLIFAVLDYFIPVRPISSVVTKSHVLAGLAAIFLVTLSVITIIFSTVVPVIGWFSSSSLFLVILYLISVRIIFKNEIRTNDHKTIPVIHNTYLQIGLRHAIKRYSFFSLLVIIGGIALPFFADRLAEQGGLSKSFVGTFMVATATSLPELVVAVAAVKLGSIDIAVGNLLGSNIFNMLILALDDFLYTKGPLLSVANENHALSGLATLLMTSVVGIGILYSSHSKRFALGIDAILLILVYISLMLAHYSLR